MKNFTLNSLKANSMEDILFCQSCGMPLHTDKLKGTENNGIKSNDYCKYCYMNSDFKNPEMNLDDMKNVVQTYMEKRNLPSYMIQKAVHILPALKRWKSKQQQ
ncbi:zinc ribbon domain-containing protein [Flavobacterium sp. XS1P27]|uniref:zinc ribbon domain-containing protein n=1 Tax=Flavobacterium sp. XS1P27 TaxID=3401724 RepID=UPI003AAFA0B0